MTSVAPADHPRLFWNRAEMQALRDKAADPRMAALRDAVLARCSRYADPAHPAFIDTTLQRAELIGVTHGCGHTWPKLPDLILAALLTDDARWFELLAGVLRVLPLTGVVLPFVSYGGSALVANYVLLALLIRVSDGSSRKGVR